MKKIVMKRFLAYFVDLVLFSIIFFFLENLISDTSNMVSLQNELNQVNEKFLMHNISFSQYFKQFSMIFYDIQQIKVPFYLVNCFLLLGYFVLIPYFFHGQTFGKYLFHLRIVREDSEELMLNDLLIRNFIVNGLSFFLLSLVLLFIVSNQVYFLFVSILGFIQILLVIISGFMVLYRKDNLALEDQLSHTKVINEVKE